MKNKQNKKQNKELEEKIKKILLTSKFDSSNITYWDGCLPEIMEAINREKLELIERIRIEFWRGATKDEAHRRLGEFKKEIEGEGKE